MGFILIIISSALYPFVDVLKKKATNKFPVKIIFWGIAVFTLPVYAVYLIIQGIPEVEPSFWLIISIDIPLLILTNILLIKDEKIAPISTTLPLLSFTPVFLIITSYIFLREMPNVYGIIGIFLVVIGAILLKGEVVRKSLMLRLRNIFTKKSNLYILVIAFIWSFNANFSKMAMQKSSVAFYLFIITLVEAIIMSIWMISKHRGHLKNIINKHVMLVLGAALITAVAGIMFLIGLETTFVSYAIAIKRAFLIVGSIGLGAVVFHEKNIKYRIAGALVMIFGIIFILVLH